jgi:hypothetical protein
VAPVSGFVVERLGVEDDSLVIHDDGAGGPLGAALEVLAELNVVDEELANGVALLVFEAQDLAAEQGVVVDGLPRLFA